MLFDVTVIDCVVCPVLHEYAAPADPVAVNSEFPQLSVTDTPGADGIDFGTAVALAEGLVQPFAVCVTVYVPFCTVMELVVSPVLHENVAPETPAADSNELPQLLTTAITGAVGIALGAAVALPKALVIPPTV